MNLVVAGFSFSYIEFWFYIIGNTQLYIGYTYTGNSQCQDWNKNYGKRSKMELIQNLIQLEFKDWVLPDDFIFFTTENSLD